MVFDNLWLVAVWPFMVVVTSLLRLMLSVSDSAASQARECECLTLGRVDLKRLQGLSKSCRNCTCGVQLRFYCQLYSQNLLSDCTLLSLLTRLAAASLSMSLGLVRWHALTVVHQLNYALTELSQAVSSRPC